MAQKYIPNFIAEDIRDRFVDILTSPGEDVLPELLGSMFLIVLRNVLRIYFNLLMFYISFRSYIDSFFILLLHFRLHLCFIFCLYDS